MSDKAHYVVLINGALFFSLVGEVRLACALAFISLLVGLDILLKAHRRKQERIKRFLESCKTTIRL